MEAFEPTKAVADAGGIVGGSFAGPDGETYYLKDLLDGTEHGPQGKVVTDDPIIAGALATMPTFKPAAVGDARPSVEKQRERRAEELDRLSVDDVRMHVEHLGIDSSELRTKDELLRAAVDHELPPREVPAPSKAPAAKPAQES